MSISLPIKILIVIAAFLLLLIVLIAGYFSYKLLIDRKIKKIRDVFGHDKTKAMDSTLKRVYIISRTNDKFQEKTNQLNGIHDQYNLVLEKCKKRIDKLEATISSNQFFKFGITRLLWSVSNYEKELRILENKFNNIAQLITHQDEYVRKEFITYQGLIRKIVQIYNDKSLLLKPIDSKIQDILTIFRNIEREFEEAVKRADTSKSDELAKQMLLNVQIFCQAVDEGPAISMLINKLIPDIIQKLKILYGEKLKSNLPLKHLDFANTEAKNLKMYDKAKKAFEDLEIDRTKEIVKGILKSFTLTEKLIIYEEKCKEIFTNCYSGTLEQIGICLTNYVKIKKQFRTLIDANKIVSDDAIEMFENIKIEANDLDIIGDKFKNILEDVNSVYSAKISRMKLILNKINKLNNMYNKFVELIWSLNIEESLLRNKYKRAEAALNEILAHVKQEAVQLSKVEQEEFRHLIDEKTSITNDVDEKKIGRDLSEKVDAFTSRVTNFYTIVNGNAQIAMHVKNMMKELSSKRAMSEILNLALLQAEQNYLEGKYVASLQTIIDSLERIGN